jgi:hypothetical protein
MSCTYSFRWLPVSVVWPSIPTPTCSKASNLKAASMCPQAGTTQTRSLPLWMVSIHISTDNMHKYPRCDIQMKFNLKFCQHCLMIFVESALGFTTDRFWLTIVKQNLLLLGPVALWITKFAAGWYLVMWKLVVLYFLYWGHMFGYVGIHHHVVFPQN